MIIYGWRTCESVVGAGAFGCPSCRTQQSYRHVVHKRWFTLYFIPLFPLGHVGEQVECEGCFSRFGLEALYGGHADEPMMAIVIDEQGKPQQPPMSQPTQLLQPMRPQVFGPLAQAPKMSQLAIASLILGLLSPVLLCVFGLSLLTSLGAIVTGHLALGKIKRDPFQLAGHGQAIIGLVMGYLFLVASIGAWAALGPAVYEAWQKDQQAGVKPPDSNHDRLLSAEMRVLTVSTEGVATRNTAAAKELAGDYAEALQAMAGTLFTKGRDPSMSLTDGHFVVHCERHPGRCAFIVHVPSYRDFSEDAKALLEARAWQLAEQSVAGELQPGDLLAVGLRGSVKYGAVLAGIVGDSNGSSFTRVDRDSLVAFFPANDREPPVVPALQPAPATAERTIAAVPPLFNDQCPLLRLTPITIWQPGRRPASGNPRPALGSHRPALGSHRRQDSQLGQAIFRRRLHPALSRLRSLRQCHRVPKRRPLAADRGRRRRWTRSLKC